jgi:hypothetical protein
MFKFLASCFQNLISFTGWFRDELQHPRKRGEGGRKEKKRRWHKTSSSYWQKLFILR